MTILLSDGLFIKLDLLIAAISSSFTLFLVLILFYLACGRSSGKKLLHMSSVPKKLTFTVVSALSA